MEFVIVMSSVVAMVFVNAWHTILLRMPDGGQKPHTISHHAVRTAASLRSHRLIHTITSIAMLAFALVYLAPRGYVLAASLLIGAAIFDILEVLTLNKSTASEISAVNYHAVTAWAMAFCYLGYTTVIIPIPGLPSYVVGLVWGSFAVLLVVAILRKFKSFWIIQHLYFCFLALVMIIAHLLMMSS